jgi:hypothetical protein
MERYVHVELRAVFSAVAAAVAGMAVTGGVRGFPSVSVREAGSLIVLVLAFETAFTLLKASRLRWFSEVRDYEAAVPVAETGAALPADASLRHRPFSVRVLVGGLVVGVAVGLLWEPWVPLLLLWAAVDWLGQAGLAARWERRHGRVLWQGHDSDEPWRLSFSVRPSPGTTTPSASEAGNTGDAMDRYVHHELRSAAAALIAAAVTAAVAGGFRGFPPVRLPWWWPAGSLAYVVLYPLLQASRIKGVSRVRDFDAAVPLAPDTPLPTAPLRRDTPVSWGFLPVLLVPTLPLALFVSAWFAATPLWMAVDWASRAAVCAYWERKNGRLIWRGHIGSKPWELSYSLVPPLSPSPPTRTATDAPPA